MRSVRAAVVSRTGIEINPKVRCPFQTVEAMQKLLHKSFPGSRVPKPDRPDSLPTCKVSRAGAKKARRCVREATKEEWTLRESSRGWGYRKCGKQRTCGRGFLEVWQRKELAADFADVWQIKDLGTVASDERPTAGERLRSGSPLRSQGKGGEVVVGKGVASLHWMWG